MADLSTHIENIQKAARGETVRDAICDALEDIEAYGGNSNGTWNGHYPDEYILKTDVNKLFLGETVNLNGVDFKAFDDAPTKDSKKAVTSKGIYASIVAISEAVDEINGEVI